MQAVSTLITIYTAMLNCSLNKIFPNQDENTKNFKILKASEKIVKVAYQFGKSCGILG